MRRWVEMIWLRSALPSLRRGSLAVVAILLAATLAQADDNWFQFRGPGGQGMSNSKGIAIHWSETENITWKTPLPGKGWSSPVILNGQIWMTAAMEEGHSMHALCVDAETGTLIHDVEVFKVAGACPAQSQE